MRDPPTDESRHDVDGLIDEARASERAGRFGVARTRYESALRRLEGPSDAALASALLRWIGRSWEASGDLDAALDCYEAARASAELAGSTLDLAHVLNCYGVIAFRRGQLEQAEDYYHQSRALAEEANEDRLLAMLDQNLGNVANVHGDHRAAQEWYQRSLRRYRSLGLEEYVGPLLLNIGRVHVDLREWSEADATLDTAEESCDRSGNVAFKVLVRVQRTRLQLAREDFQAAREACDDALDLALELGEKRWLGEIHMNAGTINRRLGRSSMAEDRLLQALHDATGRQDLLLEAEIRREMAYLYRAQRRNAELLECLNRAHETFAQLRARHDLATISREIVALERGFEEIVAEWADSIESADHYTRGHCERVAGYACRLAIAAGLDRRALPWFRMGALLHDVGKVGIPPEILNKPGPLTAEEWSVIHEHPQRGVELLSDVDFPWDIRPMVLHHHEHWDGGGYPHGLAGEAIPVAARVLCVADVFDALTTTRSYRGAFSHRAALEIMQGDAGHIFDPRLFEHFERLVREDRGAGAYLSAFGGRDRVPGRLPAGLREPPMPV
jgi:HD-GYP domain-containing protein (c-di-GMP phosphodiesterase class II)